MLADTPNIDGRTTAGGSSGEISENGFPDGRDVGLPVSRMGLEQEFFLVDLRGEPCERADQFLWKCLEEARAEIYIGDSPTGFAEGAHRISADDAQATARAAKKELA